MRKHSSWGMGPVASLVVGSWLLVKKSQPPAPTTKPATGPGPNNERGVSLITVIIIMLTMALIGASLAELSSSVNFSVQNILDETKARYLAEAGIAHALHELRAGGDLSGTVDENENAIFFPLGEGGYTVVYNPNESSITCTGIVNETKKTLQLQYNVF